MGRGLNEDFRSISVCVKDIDSIWNRLVSKSNAHFDRPKFAFKRYDKAVYPDSRYQNVRSDNDGRGSEGKVFISDIEFTCRDSGYHVAEFADCALRKVVENPDRMTQHLNGDFLCGYVTHAIDYLSVKLSGDADEDIYFVGCRGGGPHRERSSLYIKFDFSFEYFKSGLDKRIYKVDIKHTPPSSLMVFRLLTGQP